MLRSIMALLLMILIWAVFDYALHFSYLAPLYEANPLLWRPLDQISIPLVFAVRGALALCFLGLYQLLVNPKSLGHGLLFGLILGVLLGVSVGLGTWLHMPVPFDLAVGWFVGALVKALLAGAVLGLMVRAKSTRQKGLYMD